MRTKKNFSFNEEQLSEDIISAGFENGIDYGKMYLVAKYFREKFNYGEKRLEKEIVDFCTKQDPLFNPVLERDAIRRWVNSALKYNLRKIDSVVISLRDIELLKNISVDKDRRILFATLVLSKALKNSSTRRKTKKDTKRVSPNFYIRYNNFSDIISLSGIPGLTENRLLKILHKYKDFFFFYYPEKRLVRVDFIDKNPEKEYEISNMDNIKKEYESIFGKNVSACSKCGSLFEKRGRNHFMCDECAKEADKEKNKKAYEKWKITHGK